LHSHFWLLQVHQINILTRESLLKHGGGIGKRMSDLVAYVDGGSLGNPGPSGIGVVIEGGASGTIRIAKWIGRQDNNVAEYVALLEALQCALALKAKVLHVYSDSEVVVRQMQGSYACRSPRLYSLHWICRKLARSFQFSITHVPRERNAEANGLANSAVRQRLAAPTEAGARSVCAL
jgi:ribonuclease HI